MTGPYLVGIDCGSQSAKVVVFDATGRAVARGQQPLQPMSRPRPGVVLHPDDDLWTATATATRRAMAGFDGDPAAIVGVGLCPIRCCKAYLDAGGELIEPVMSWMDDRAYRPYLPDDPRLAFVTTASGYLASRCTGRHTDTAANDIELQWPIDVDRWTWSDDPAAYARHGVRREQLFDLQLPGEVIGPLTDAAAAATGLPAGVPVVHTANDKAVEMLGAGALGDRTALVSLGTYIAAMVHGSANHPDGRAFWTNFSAVPGRYLYESNGVRRGMWTLSWFLDLLGPEFAAHAAASGLSREQYLEREAIEVAAGSDGLMIVLDWLATADHPYRKGTMLGFDARHTRGHVYRAIMEAIALTMKGHVDAMVDELGGGIDEIVLSGGGATSRLFVQIFADVFGIAASRPIGGGGAALGAAICAAVATGVHAGFEEAVAAMTAGRESFEPYAARTDLYRQATEAVFRHIRPATDPLYERAHPLFH
ncbi:MAG: sugar kinase [Acidimicrobiales bacterium]|nr:sugar kinase [Acidimicrobiales bacterium]MCB9395534.1 sugar kinase [Acidimicrobiaceae bacterium]